MKVLTIKEPWASLIVNGYKKYEFRTWKTNYRGKVLIQASISPDYKNMELLKEYNIKYSKGEIIGEVEIFDCKLVDNDFHNQIIKENALVYKKSPLNGYAFCLKNAKKYKNKIPCRGQLGIWNYGK